MHRKSVEVVSRKLLQAWGKIDAYLLVEPWHSVRWCLEVLQLFNFFDFFILWCFVGFILELVEFVLRQRRRYKLGHCLIEQESEIFLMNDYLRENNVVQFFIDSLRIVRTRIALKGLPVSSIAALH